MVVKIQTTKNIEMRFTINIFFGLAVIFFLFSCAKSENGALQKQPNVVFVMADQWRAQATGYNGDKNVKTPHLDKLAQEQINFTNAIASTPVCAPSRATILTGQYPLTHGVFYNDKPLKTEATTLADVFKQAGYKTGYIGKWHLNGHENDEKIWEKRLQPIPVNKRLGFEYWKTMECTHKYNTSDYFDENDQKHSWEGYDAEIQTDSAISFIHKNKENPFFLYLSWGPPHNPYTTAPEQFVRMYDSLENIVLRPNVPDSLKEKARKNLAGYYAHCTALDTYIGRLQLAISKASIEDNTIFIFTSDHGDMLESQGQFAKQKPWDESIKVPFLLKYPAQISKAQKIATPFVTADIMPTILGLSNLEIPTSVEGNDFSSHVLSNEKMDIKAGLILCPVPFHEWSVIRGGKEYRGVRTERYTYVKDLNGPWLLYDNKEDPYQQSNLVNINSYAPIQAELEQELKALLIKTNDDFKPADYYMKKWNYTYDALDTIIFSNKYPN